MDATEAFANAIIGLLVSWLATIFVLGFSPAKSIAITAKRSHIEAELRQINKTILEG